MYNSLSFNIFTFMKCILAIMSILGMSCGTMMAAEPLTLKDVISKTFRAEVVSGIRPLEATSDYTRISDDEKRVERYSFKTGKRVAVLFDLENLPTLDSRPSTLDSFDDYVISPDGKRLLLQTNTQAIYRHSFTAEYYLWETDSKTLTKLSANGPQQVPTFSPDSRKVAFVRDNNIFITDGVNELQVTSDGKKNEIINGIPDWVNEEEFSFNNAMAWSADSRSLSWLRYDELDVKTYALQMFRGENPARDEYADYPGEYRYKYPKAGQQNSTVTAWTYDLQQNSMRQLNVPVDSDSYMPRIIAVKNPASAVVVATMNRHQDILRYYRVSTLTDECCMLIEEKVPCYVKEETIENTVFTDNHIILPSDRDGYTHLYLYDKDGTLIRQMEKGEYDVTAVYGYDEKHDCVYLQAALPSPMERSVVRVDSHSQQVITPQKGWNGAIFSSDFNYFISTWSDSSHPYVFSLCNNRGKQQRTILDNDKLEAQIEEHNLPHPESFQFTTSEGVTLNGWMMKPVDFDATKRYPVIMYQYGGPGSQQVTNSWRIGSMAAGALFDAYLTQQGFIVACVDGRGTGARGAKFEKQTYLCLGELEARDQVEAALYLGDLPFVDKDKIGIWGWSFGGFNTLMSMSEGRPVFRCGVAIAPPTNWKYYDSVYTERYMRTPQENADGYAVNPIQRAENMHGTLLLCHGLADDNVHPQNMFEYTEALVQADKDFRELIYTNRNHSIYGGNTRHHLLRQVVNHFIENLK